MNINFTVRVWHLLLVGVTLTLLGVFVPRDDTDSSEERSGMVLYTDHGTGCQYLSRPLFSSLTPRMDEQGKQVCLPELRNQK